MKFELDRQGSAAFCRVPKIVEKLRVLEEVGSDICAWSVGDDSLGGEAQRMKLAAASAASGAEFGRRRATSAPPHRTLYIFDEPTTGFALR